LQLFLFKVPGGRSERGAKEFQESTSTPSFPPTFRAYGYRITIECVGITVEAQAQKSLLVSGNNYVKVREKGPYASDRKGVKMDPKVQQFLLCFKNNAFTAYF